MDLCKIRMAYRATFAWILFVLVWISCNFMTTSAGQTELDTFACEWPIRHARIVYERSELFNLGGSLEDTAPPNPDIPDDLRLRPRKRGKRGVFVSDDVDLTHLCPPSLQVMPNHCAINWRNSLLM